MYACYDHSISPPPMQCRGESTGRSKLISKSKILSIMKKRTILKKISGVKKDTTNWFGIVLSASFVNGTLFTEKLIFVTKDIYDAVEDGQTINVQ